MNRGRISVLAAVAVVAPIGSKDVWYQEAAAAGGGGKRIAFSVQVVVHVVGLVLIAVNFTDACFQTAVHFADASDARLCPRCAVRARPRVAAYVVGEPACKPPHRIVE